MKRQSRPLPWCWVETDSSENFQPDVFLEQDKTPASREQVTEAMKSAAAERKRVMLKADVDTEYGKVRPVLDWASKAKLKGVSLAAEELKGK